MIDLKIQLVKLFPGWSLYDIDNTDLESLMPFLTRLTGASKGNHGKGRTKRVYCDDPQASWL